MRDLIIEAAKRLREYINNELHGRVSAIGLKQLSSAATDIIAGERFDRVRSMLNMGQRYNVILEYYESELPEEAKIKSEVNAMVDRAMLAKGFANTAVAFFALLLDGEGAMPLADALLSEGDGSVRTSKLSDFVINGTKLEKYVGEGGEVFIPDFVTEIAREAFLKCDRVTGVVVPASVRVIEDSAFSACSSLKYCQLPDSVEHLGGGAFWACTSLERIRIPRKIRKIYGYTFTSCWSLCEVDMPEVDELIGENAFYCCSALKEIRTYRPLREVAPNAFDQSAHIILDFGGVRIPAGEYFDYQLEGKRLVKYLGRGESVHIPEGIAEIGREAFLSSETLTEVWVPNSVTRVEDSAFSNCVKLERAHLCDSILELGGGAFWNCQSLKEITLPRMIKGVRGYTFVACVSLSRVDMPEVVEYIGEYAFCNCPALRELALPVGKRRVSELAFKDSAGLVIVEGNRRIPALEYGK